MAENGSSLSGEVGKRRLRAWRATYDEIAGLSKHMSSSRQRLLPRPPPHLPDTESRAKMATGGFARCGAWSKGQASRRLSPPLPSAAVSPPSRLLCGLSPRCCPVLPVLARWPATGLTSCARAVRKLDQIPERQGGHQRERARREKAHDTRGWTSSRADLPHVIAAPSPTRASSRCFPIRVTLDQDRRTEQHADSPFPLLSAGRWSFICKPRTPHRGRRESSRAARVPLALPAAPRCVLWHSTCIHCSAKQHSSRSRSNSHDSQPETCWTFLRRHILSVSVDPLRQHERDLVAVPVSNMRFGLAALAADYPEGPSGQVYDSAVGSSSTSDYQSGPRTEVRTARDIVDS
jgi:hypothetical protein